MTEFLILALATWRLASLLATEDGPFDMFLRFRLLVGVGYDGYGNPIGLNTFAKGLSCVWCSSIWFGFFWTVLFIVFNDIAVYLSLPFALSAGAVIVERIAGGNEQ